LEEEMIAPEIASTARWECVHFGTLLEGRKEIERCKERGFSAIQVDLAGVQEKSELLARIASAMKFPDYFGMNWDALDECLRDLSWLNPRGVLLVLENSRDLWRQPMVAGSLIETWLFCAESWAKDNVPFHLGFTWD
jgi:RNAse (barnase) inhibitor barstar